MMNQKSDTLPDPKSCSVSLEMPHAPQPRSYTNSQTQGSVPAPSEAGAGVEGRAHGSAGMGPGNDKTVSSALL